MLSEKKKFLPFDTFGCWFFCELCRELYPPLRRGFKNTAVDAIQRMKRDRIAPGEKESGDRCSAGADRRIEPPLVEGDLQVAGYFVLIHLPAEHSLACGPPIRRYAQAPDYAIS